MEDSPKELAFQVRELTRAVTELRGRVDALEAGARFERPALARTAPPEPDDGVPTAQAVIMSFAPGGIAPLFGWAFLGMAGAYLLRALTESGAVPGLVGAGLG